MPAMQPPKTVNIFYCYAYKDRAWQKKLKDHLSNLKQQGLINDWDHHDISAGQNREKTIGSYLNNAHIILLFISSDFMVSDYWQGHIMTRAMERHNNGEAEVVPILVKSVDFSNAPFSGLQMLPESQKPLVEWSSNNRDRVLSEIVVELRKIIFDILDKPDYVDELYKEYGLVDNTTKTSKTTRATRPSPSHARTKGKANKQVSAQTLADTASYRSVGKNYKKFFPRTNKKTLLEDIKAIIQEIEIPNFFHFLVYTSINTKKFKRYNKGNPLLGFWFFLIFDVILAIAGIHYWLHLPIITTLLAIMLILLFLWNSCNEHTFTSITLSLLFSTVWFVLGTHYFSQISPVIILIASAFAFYPRLLLVKPKK